MKTLDALIKQQKHIDLLLPKYYFGLTSQLSWLNKINNIKHAIPKQEAILNFNTLTLDNNFSSLTKHFKWLKDFERLSKPFSQFDNLFRVGQHYKYIEIDLAELYEEFDETETAAKDETPTSIIITETQRVKEIIKDIYINNLNLFKIQPREFEKIIAELLYNQGFEVELTKQTRDNGYDILALKYIDNFSPIKYLVECKRYNEKRKVGVEIIRSFKEVIATEQANKGIIVTSSYFTLDALKKQKETPSLLDYKNKDEVINWVNEYTNKKNYR